MWVTEKLGGLHSPTSVGNQVEVTYTYSFSLRAQLNYNTSPVPLPKNTNNQYQHACVWPGFRSEPVKCIPDLELGGAEVTFAKYLDLSLRLLFIPSSRWSAGKCFLLPQQIPSYPEGRARFASIVKGESCTREL